MQLYCALFFTLAIATSLHGMEEYTVATHGSFDQLPRELQAHVIGNLNGADLIHFLQTSTQNHSLLKDLPLTSWTAQHLFEELYKNPKIPLNSYAQQLLARISNDHSTPMVIRTYLKCVLHAYDATITIQFPTDEIEQNAVARGVTTYLNRNEIAKNLNFELTIPVWIAPELHDHITDFQDVDSNVISFIQNKCYQQAFERIENYADINVRSVWPPDHGKTAFMKACQNGDIKIVEILISVHADINKTDYNQMTPLHLATQSGHTDVVALLLQHGADATLKNCFGNTALHYAQLYGHTATAELLEPYTVVAPILIEPVITHPAVNQPEEESEFAVVASSVKSFFSQFF